MSDPREQPGSVRIERPDPIIAVDQVAWVLFDKADLDETDRFLRDFGLLREGECGEGRLFRGTGTLPYLYIARPAARSAFVGTGFLAKSRDDLERLADATGRPVEPLERPGGGECVRLEDPHGFLVEVAFGIEPVAALADRTEPLPVNTPYRKNRVGEGQRAPLCPAAVVRLGHSVVQSTRFDEAVAWYMRHLGLIATDVQCLPNGRPALAFLRTDRGQTPSDHHAFVVGMGFRDAFLHAAFEVLDIDALGQGQQVMRAGGWRHAWGIARHVLGSQLFDYWRDPDGFELEHYADGDVFLADHPTEYSALDRRGLWQWGVDLPSDFGPRLGPSLIIDIVREWRAGRVDIATIRQFGRIAGLRPRAWLR